jgi:hypothetical protein
MRWTMDGGAEDGMRDWSVSVQRELDPHDMAWFLWCCVTESTSAQSNRSLANRENSHRV